MSDPTPAFEPQWLAGERGPAGPPDLSVDLGAFLPEGSIITGGSGEAQAVAADFGVLEQLEIDLADVDVAIEAIDADDHARSSLLQTLIDLPSVGDQQNG